MVEFGGSGGRRGEIVSSFLSFSLSFFLTHTHTFSFLFFFPLLNIPSNFTGLWFTDYGFIRLEVWRLGREREYKANERNFSAIVAALIINPIFLAVLLACYLRLHLVCAHVTNRCAMGLSVLLGVHFMVNVVGMYLLDVFPGAEVNQEYKTCWKDDGVMRALGDWGWWARSVVVCGAVVGVMGACT